MQCWLLLLWLYNSEYCNKHHRGLKCLFTPTFSAGDFDPWGWSRSDWPSFGMQSWFISMSVHAILSLCAAVMICATLVDIQTHTGVILTSLYEQLKLLSDSCYSCSAAYSQTSASARSISRHMAIWPLLTPKTWPSMGLFHQNRRRPVWDMAEPPCKISRGLAKLRLRNP